MAYEEFTFKRRPVMDTPMVSILKQGIMGLNGACYTTYFKKYKYATFLYDKTNNSIAIKPTNDASSNSYNIRVGKDARLANISAIAFVKYYKIPHEETRSYVCTWNSKENMLEIDLGQK